MTYWWVNQNETYAHEVNGGYLWSPKTNADGRGNHFYDNMTRVQPGDAVLSFCDSLIKAVGIATGKRSQRRRHRSSVVQGLQFTELNNPMRPKTNMSVLGPMLPPRYFPLQSNGNGNQGVYLAEFRMVIFRTVTDHIGHGPSLTKLGPISIQGHSPVEVYGYEAVVTQ